MNVFILGGDGYIGWPLSYELALLYPEIDFYIFDNFTRRKLTQLVGGMSATPILSLPDRIEEFKVYFKQKNLHFYEMDVADSGFKEILIQKKPSTIYHLAQQPSAHYSMKGMEESIFTLRNNEEGNLKLLWYVKEFLPEAHVIKLGSFGEYAQCGLNIPEGYFKPYYQDQLATDFTPFPRESNDVYHITKINDTNFITMACRNWNLRITDVMQATIFGTHLENRVELPFLYTRLDYDEYFGTVINRFIVQAILGIPLTIYGTGKQRTGLMSLDDAVASLCNIFKAPPNFGEHQVINNLVDKDYCINELAILVQEIGKELNLDVSVAEGDYNPRNENISHKKQHNIYTSVDITTRDIKEVIYSTFKVLLSYKEKLDRKIIFPSFDWYQDKNKSFSSHATKETVQLSC